MHAPADHRIDCISTAARSGAAAALLFGIIAAAMLGTPKAQAADRDALKHIVQDHCLPHWRAQHDPAPCARVVPPDFAVLADRKGGAHFLLIATGSVTGIEDPALLRPGAPNFFAAAWDARDHLERVRGHPLRREEVGLAVNSALMRGQDQLHIHIECIRADVREALQEHASALTAQWQPIPIDGHSFEARRIEGADLSGADPFAMLAGALPGARDDMRAWTIVVAGMQFPQGPGFIVLAGRTPARADALLLPAQADHVPPGETLLDSTCAVDR